MVRVLQLILVAVVLALSLVVAPTPVSAAEITVGENGCTLADAIVAANTNTAVGDCPAGEGHGGIDVIILEDGAIYDLDVAAHHDDYGATGLPAVTDNLAIDGNGATIRRAANATAFRVLRHTGGVLQLRDLTISNGIVDAADGLGGCILSTSPDQLSIRDSVLTACSAGGGGNAIAADYLRIERSTLHNNLTGVSVLHVGILRSGDLTVLDSTITNNHGAGFVLFSIIPDDIAIALTERATIVDNSLTSAVLDANSVLQTSGSILIPTPLELNETSEIADHGGNMLTGDPMLGPLADNGGTTPTRMPLPGSPVIDTGATGRDCSENNDQRGVSRPQGSGCDKGAVEVLATAPVLTLPDSPFVAEATSPAGANVTYDATAVDYAGRPVPVNCTPASGAQFAITSTTVECAATDGEDVTTTGEFTVQVQDTIAPVTTVAVTAASVPLSDGDVTNQSVSITLSNVENGSGIQQGTYSVTRNNVFVTGGSYASEVTFGLTLDGQYVITSSATDIAGNTESTQTVSFTIDRTAPSITAPADITVNATSEAGATVDYTITATDLVDGPITPTCDWPGYNFPIGTIVVTCTATDQAGNTAQATFSVTVEGTGVQFVDLTEMVQQLPISGDASTANTIRRNMLSMVSLAQGFNAAGAEGASCLMLTRLEAEVRTQVSKRRLTARNAQTLYAKIDEVQAVVGCGGSAPG